MAALATWFRQQRLSSLGRRLILSAGLVVYVALLTSFVVIPQWRAVNEAVASFRRAAAKTAAAAAVYQERQVLEEQVTTLSQQVAAADAEIPGYVGMSEFLHYLHGAAVTNGVTIESLTFPAPTAVGAYQQYLIQFTVQGPYQGVAELVGGIESYPRLVRVDAMEITLPQQSSQTAQSSPGAPGTSVTNTVNAPPAGVLAHFDVYLYVNPQRGGTPPPVHFTEPTGRGNPFGGTP